MTREMTAAKVALLVLYFSTVMSEKDSKTPYEEMKHYIKIFDTRGLNTGSYSLLSVDKEQNNLLVGARNAAFLVNLDDIDSYEHWSVSNPSSSAPCDKNEDNHCNNFVKIMLPFKERILLCWTEQPFTGSCTWRNRTNLRAAPGRDIERNVFRSVEDFTVPSKGPDQNDTAVITDDGMLFTGTFQPYRDKSLIYSKSFKEPRQREVYTSLDNDGSFYDDVHFVKSFEIGHYVYFFFRERTLECASCGKLEISRVARICKGDCGGRFRLTDIFVTFQKAKLSCSDGKDYPVNFNEIQDVWWDNDTSLFHAIFTSQPNAAPSSAICIYSLSSINRVFDESPFKSFKNNDEHWSRIANKHKEYFAACKVNPKYIRDSSSVPDGMMATAKMTNGAYQQLMHDPLMDEAVRPTSSRAWFIKGGVRMTGISLDRVGANTVVYASTDRGSVVKIFQPSGIAQPCLLTEMDVFPDGKKEVIKRMVIDANRNMLYLGSHSTLTKLRLEQCNRFLHDKSSCLFAADPYCGWDDQSSSCVSVLSHGASSDLKQNLSVCPKAKEIGWSAWGTCVQSDGNLCRCQRRPCQDAQNSSCTGDVEIRLENCTVDTSVGWEGKEAWEVIGVQHGNWSVWGNWSECSTKAWTGVRNRTRTCSNPVPKRGGKPCVGESVQYEPCSLGIQEEEKSLLTNPTRVLNPSLNLAVKFKVTCRARGYKITGVSVEMSNETIDCVKDRQQCREGVWNRWGEWSPCSIEGFQIRRRKCKEEPCVGERLQERSCQPKTVTVTRNCEGGVEKTWDEWSACICNHGLNMSKESGVMYRVPKCRGICPNVAFCADSVEFQPCKCQSVGVSARQQVSGPAGHSNFGIGHMIGAFLVGCAIAIVLCVVAICYVNRKKNNFSVSKAEENSLHDTSSVSRYSTIPRENGQSMKEPLSPTSSGKREKNGNSKLRTPSPLKIIFPKRNRRYPVDSV